MTNDQLTLDGSSPRRPRRLTERQRDLLRWMRISAERGYPVRPHVVYRFYADPYGALRRLERIGLVRHDRAGEWWPT